MATPDHGLLGRFRGSPLYMLVRRKAGVPSELARYFALAWGRCWINIQLDKAGRMRRASSAFGLLGLAGLAESVLFVNAAPRLSLTFLAFAISCAVVVVDLLHVSNRERGQWTALRGMVAGLIALVLTTTGDGAGGLPHTADGPWPLWGMLNFAVAVGVMTLASRTWGLRWFASRIAFVVFGAWTGCELLLRMLRYDFPNGHMAISLIVATGIGLAAWFEAVQLFRARELFRRLGS